MKKYFLQFDYFNKDINKFYFGVVDVDLNETLLIDLCRQIVKDSHHDLNGLDVEIKVNALNNVEL